MPIYLRACLKLYCSGNDLRIAPWYNSFLEAKSKENKSMNLFRKLIARYLLNLLDLNKKMNNSE
jgi:hypothetical protein